MNQKECELLLLPNNYMLFAMLVDKIIVHKDKTLGMVWKGNA